MNAVPTSLVLFVLAFPLAAYAFYSLPKLRRAVSAFAGLMGAAVVASSAQAGFAVGPSGGTVSISGTGVAHVTSGTLDAAALHCTSGQHLVSTGTDLACATIAGDLSCVSGGPCTVNKISGATPIAITPNELQWVAGAVPLIDQAAAATPSNMTITAQAATVGPGGNGANLVLNPGAGDVANGGADGQIHLNSVSADTHVNVLDQAVNIRGDSVILAGSTDGTGGLPAFQFEPVANGPSTILVSDGVASFAVSWANGTTASAVGGNSTFQGQNETGATSTGGGAILRSGSGTSANGAAKINVAATTIWTYDDNGPGPGTQTIALTNANVTLSAAQAKVPLQIYTGTLTGNVAVTYPNAAKVWLARVDGLTLGSNTLTFKSGTGSCTALSTIAGLSQVVMIVGSGSNTCAINQ